MVRVKRLDNLAYERVEKWAVGGMRKRKGW